MMAKTNRASGFKITLLSLMAAECVDNVREGGIVAHCLATFALGLSALGVAALCSL